MKRLLILFTLLSFIGFGQLNMTELGWLDVNSAHSTELNDIWAYVDEEGNEYALVGAQDGVSIVDITDPTSPVEVFWVDGLNSIWRDLKTWGDYAYITTEATEGLMIIDLSGLPGDTDLPVSFYHGPEDSEWESAHNLYQDDGYVYIFGANRDEGGVIILDVATDPLNPIEVGVFDNWYAHDGYVVNDTGYFGHIYEGFFSIVDLTDKTDPVLLGTFSTPSSFTHNIWVSEDGNYAFTTDEKTNGFIASFEISDPSSIIFKDRIQSSPGLGIVPHNSFVKDNYLYTSYYTDGVVVHDITHPHNMVEVGNFDTTPLQNKNTDGCWGVYPYLPSGNLIATDKLEGMFVLGFEENQGSYLEGNITELVSGTPINNVRVSIDADTIIDYSLVTGDYGTGTILEGEYDVTFHKLGYIPQTIPVYFENGVIVTLDVELEKLDEFDLRVFVVDAQTLDPVPFVDIEIRHPYNTVTNYSLSAGRNFSLYYEDLYEIHVGGDGWGHIPTCIVDTLITADTDEITIYIEPGYGDNFVFEHFFDWNLMEVSDSGNWRRKIPEGYTNLEGEIQSPYTDFIGDCGEQAYVTSYFNDAGNLVRVMGETRLRSPSMDLTSYENPVARFSTWFYSGGEGVLNDTLRVFIRDETFGTLGNVRQLAKFYAGGEHPMSEWVTVEIPILPTTVDLSESMRIEVSISNFDDDNTTIAGFDNFLIYEMGVTELIETDKQAIQLYPNPFSNELNLFGITSGTVSVFDLSGRLVTETPVSPTLDLSKLQSGTYLFVVKNEEQEIVQTFRQIKF